MPATRSARSLTALLVVVGGALAATAAGRLSVPDWTPKAPDYRRKGPAQAKAVIAEFSDFMCPACAAAAPHLKSIEGLYPDQVAVVYKHRAWDQHVHARTAAFAAECAGKAGKFWEMHDTLFAQQSSWGVLESTAAARAAIVGYAKGLGLDPAALSSCMDDPATQKLVTDDLAEADSIWIHATPTFIIGGKRFVGSNQLRTLGLNRVEDLVKKGKS